MLIYCDIDNTICKTTGNDYENAVPIPENIAKMNKLWNEGHTIVYWTSRGNTSGKNLWSFTQSQLVKWGCRFNSLFDEKPSYDIFIDDKCRKIEDL
jgi:hypothetical protein